MAGGDAGSWIPSEALPEPTRTTEEDLPPAYTDEPSYDWVDPVLQLVRAKFLAVIEAPNVVGQFPRLSFGELQNGDVVLQNTNGPHAALGLLMGFNSPAGQLGMTHTALIYRARCGPHPNPYPHSNADSLHEVWWSAQPRRSLGNV